MSQEENSDNQFSPEAIAKLQEDLKSDPSALSTFIRETTGLQLSPSRRLAKIEQRKSQPYYKDVYGQEMIGYLEELERDKQDIIFLYADFPSLSKSTLQSRLRQSLQYVEDLLDTKDKRYHNILKGVEIQMTNPRGVVLALIANMKMPLKAHKYYTMCSAADIVIVIKDFIENAEFDVKVKLPQGDMLPFVLTESERADIESLCNKFPNIISVVGEREISIIKTKPKELGEAI